MANKDAKIKHHKKLVREGEAETRKSKKNHTTPVLDGKETVPYDDEARKKEKDISAAAAAAVLAELGIDDNNDCVQKPKKTKRKAILETAPTDSDVVLAKEKRKEKKRVKSSAAIEDVAQEARFEVKERRKNVMVSDDDSEVLPAGLTVPDGQSRMSESKAGKKKKAALATSDSVAAAVGTALTAPDKDDKKAKKSKKRKHAESLLTVDETTALNVTTEGQSPRKKRHKGKSKIIDPGQDKSLSEQALKALSYAFSQYGNPAEWKFNKARQNWLIRNVWLPAMVPDEHMPLLLWYLKNVKGGARDALIKTCQTHLQLPTIPESQPKGESTTPGKTEAETTMTSLFGLSAEVLTSPSDKAQETKRSRAEIILEALEIQ